MVIPDACALQWRAFCPQGKHAYQKERRRAEALRLSHCRQPPSRLEVQLQLELGRTRCTEIVGSRAALHAKTVLHGQVIGTVQIAVDRAHRTTGRGNTRQLPGKRTEVAHVEQV